MEKKNIIFTIFIVAIILLLAFFYDGFYFPKDKKGGNVSFVIEAGEGLFSVAENLKEEDIIKNKYFFIIYGTITKGGEEIKQGKYEISSSMSIVKIMQKIISGDEKKVTIIEGWNLRDIAEYLEKEGYATKEEFYLLAGTPPFYENEKMIIEKGSNLLNPPDFLKDKKEDVSFEGYLFPDTYFISYGTSAEEIIFSFLTNFENKITEEMKGEIKESGKNLFEIITIASLLEKEVTSFEDKQIVAGIIQKRLEKGMPLQLDATITYFTGKKSVQVYIEETKIDSLYNTYLYTGLPKGPICNPGIESIKAAISPKESDYFYYLSKPNGETVFSRTFNEHIKAKNNYLK